MALVKGPFIVKWGANTLQSVQDYSFDYSVDSNDYTTLDGNKTSLEGAVVAKVSIQLLRSDVAALAVVLPQYFVPQGQALSTGDIVANASGALDIVAASCNTTPVYNNLDIISCGTNATVVRLLHARTVIDSIDLQDSTVLTFTVKFIGEPATGTSAIQVFTSTAAADSVS
jgi:hypothetical protein